MLTSQHHEGHIRPRVTGPPSSHEPFLCHARQTPRQRTESFTRILAATSGLQACLLPQEEAGDSQRALQDLGTGAGSSESDSGSPSRRDRGGNVIRRPSGCLQSHLPSATCRGDGAGARGITRTPQPGVELRLEDDCASQVNMDL